MARPKKTGKKTSAAKSAARRRKSPPRTRKRKTVTFGEGVIWQAAEDYLKANPESVKEDIWRELQISSSTWHRWQRNEPVTATAVPGIIQLLGVEPEDDDWNEDVPRAPWDILKGIEEVRKRLTRIEKKLGL